MSRASEGGNDILKETAKKKGSLSNLPLPWWCKTSRGACHTASPPWCGAGHRWLTTSCPPGWCACPVALQGGHMPDLTR